MRRLALTMLLAVANLSPTAAEPLWQPEGGGRAISSLQVTPVPRQARLTRLGCVDSGTLEVEVASDDPFPVRDALTELVVGQLVSSLSRYPDGGDTHTLIFTLTRDQLTNVSSDDQAVVRYNPSNGHDIWLIGSIDWSTVQGCEADDSDPNAAE